MPDYPTTAVPFDDMALSDLRDPVVTGPGAGGLSDAAESYRLLGELLRTASEDLRVAMTRAREAHEGGAAELAEQHVNRVVAVGELGAGQAQITAGALQDGAGFYARVRDDMNALPPVEAADSLREANRVQRDLTANKELAVEAAQRYERNANWTLGRQFQLYEAPAIDPPVTSGAAVGGGPGGVGTAGTGGLAGGGAGGGGSGVPTAVGGGVSGGPNAAPLVPVAGAPVTVGPGTGGTAIGSGAPGSGAPGSGGPGVGGPGSGGPGVGGPGVGGPGAGRAALPSGTGPNGTGPGGGVGPGRPGAGLPASLGPAAEGPGTDRYPGTDGRTGGGRLDPLAVPSSGWQPGQPWSSRTPSDPTAGGYAGAFGGTGGSPGRGVGDPSAQPGGRPPGAAAGSAPGGAARGTAGSGVPFFPGAGGAGRGQDSEHARPSWLVQDDPQAFWFSGLPDHGPGVIGGEGDCDH